MILPEATACLLGAACLLWLVVAKGWRLLVVHGHSALLLLACFLGISGAPTLVSAADVTAGHVIFVSGTATRIPSGGVTQGVSKGLPLVQGDQLLTGENAYVYVRMADNGLLVLRPLSRLQIDRWRYDAQYPELSEIKYTLDEGVARYVSGKGSHAARDKFRFNTPVAAIGVRGTDFTVFAEPSLTQVQVRSGGVVVSSLGGGCLADGLGPCEGERALELFAASAMDKVLQVRRGDSRPQLLDLADTPGPNKVRPPTAGEPHADNSSSGASAGVLVTESARAEAVQKAVTPPPSNDWDMAVWGRWGALASGKNGNDVISALVNGRSLLAINRYYAIAVNSTTPLEMPQAGVGQFRLFGHEGLMVDPKTGEISATIATAGALQIDFGARRFLTQLSLQAGDWNTTVSSQGGVESSGKFASDPFVSSLVVDGKIGGKAANEAIYLYRRPPSQGIEVSGVVSWKR